MTYAVADAGREVPARVHRRLQDRGRRRPGGQASRHADAGHRAVRRSARRPGARLGAPLIKGETTVRQREKLYEAFRTGEIDLLVVSKVANFSVDLPSAQVAIQVSGAFGSRQEEAQRLGRLLRPKSDGLTARFYAVVARDTVDADFAAHRQRFLAEQGYGYRIMDADDALAAD